MLRALRLTIFLHEFVDLSIESSRAHGPTVLCMEWFGRDLNLFKRSEVEIGSPVGKDRVDFLTKKNRLGQAVRVRF